MTEMKRFSLCIPEEMDERIIKLKMTEKYCRCSYAEIVRQLIKEALAHQHDKETG